MHAYELRHLPATVTTLVAATVIGAAGCLTLALAAPVQAYPAQGSECTQFGFKGPFAVNGLPNATHDSHWTVSFDSSGTTATGPAVVLFDSGERVTGHVVSGGGIGGRNINFRIQYDNKPNNVWDFSGTVGDDGVAKGYEYLVDGDHDATGAIWRSTTALDCLAPAPPLIQGVPKVDPPPPPVQPQAAPQDAIQMDLTKAGLQVMVSVTNTADLAGKCTYVASPANNPLLPTINRDFSIAAKGSAQLSVPAPPPFTTYHVVASCIGTFNGQSVEFGHVEKNISG